jgi:hypothetical protein
MFLTFSLVRFMDSSIRSYKYRITRTIGAKNEIATTRMRIVLLTLHHLEIFSIFFIFVFYFGTHQMSKPILQKRKKYDKIQ